MNHCSGCGYLVPEAWHECRKCGATLHAPASPTGGSPVAPAGAVATLPRVVARPVHAPARLTPAPPSDTLLPNSRTVDAPADEPALAPWAPEFQLPDTMLPVGRRAPDLPVQRSVPRIPGAFIAVAVCVVLVAGAVVMWPQGHDQARVPVVLAARAPEAGIPTGLEDVVRVQIESTRRTGVLAVEAAASFSGAGALTTPLLAAQQPGVQWLDGNQASEGPTQISAQGGPAGATIAVASKNKVLCAYARWSPEGAEYVTIKNAISCRATEPPETGWSSEAGGSDRDLPAELG